jgi:hypothetical protein
MGDPGEAVAPTIRYVEVKRGYRVGNDGSVWSCVIRGSVSRIGDTWHQLTPQPVGLYGHLQVFMGKNYRRPVHQLVLEAFVGPCPEGMGCRHLDGDPSNNHVENLAWGTQKENVADMIRHGRAGRGGAKGEEHGLAVLTDADVLEALAMRTAGETNKSIARRFNVASRTIRDLFTGKTWRHLTAVTGLPPSRSDRTGTKGEDNHTAKLTTAGVLEAMAMHREGMSQVEIARRLDIGKVAVWQIIHGVTWNNVTGLPPNRQRRRRELATE